MNQIIKLLFIFIVIGMFSQPCLAKPALQTQALLEEANSAYHEQDYILAASLYEQILKENGYSANILFNLANTYAQSNTLGKAVLNYQRAKLLEPSDPDIIGNLEAVNKQAGIFAEEKPFFNKITNFFTFNGWCYLGLFSFSLLVTAGFALFFLPTLTRPMRSTAAIAAATMALSMYMASVSHHPYTSGVIIQPETPLLISPHEKASTNGSINEGRLVTLLKEYRAFSFVKDSAGRTGWVSKKAVEAIIPPSPEE